MTGSGLDQAPAQNPLAQTLTPGGGSAAAPEWAATSPGTVVCPVPEVVAKVQRTDNAAIQVSELCLKVKRLATNGSYENLPDEDWNYTAQYRDPFNGDFHDVPRCGRRFPFPPATSSSSGSPIEIVVKILRVIRPPQGETATCEEMGPQENNFKLQITVDPPEGKSWQGEQTFLLPPSGITFDPFLLSLGE